MVQKWFAIFIYRKAKNFEGDLERFPSYIHHFKSYHNRWDNHRVSAWIHHWTVSRETSAETSDFHQTEYAAEEEHDEKAQKVQQVLLRVQWLIWFEFIENIHKK